MQLSRSKAEPAPQPFPTSLFLLFFNILPKLSHRACNHPSYLRFSASFHCKEATNMDGLSAAASGIAVVSLAIQLVDSVRQIQRFLHNVSEAPKELQRLINLLEQLELILENIGELIDRQRRQSADEDVAVSETILRAMKTCENTIKGLAGIVDVARKSAGPQRRRTEQPRLWDHYDCRARRRISRSSNVSYMRLPACLT
ncbi:uncharacterized protein K444DRAFT_192059 [Hyaloscypha bicolor E]|uniref:Fungal N-terminal domain-containing protein n=1 Tax=Hyaloscypha bicolor E TaxID=1095630 RepID=A0A2J6SPW8_9HELO|nr:uncharacterized protein K444DRAFT_192059 [Hyaloscypha bicolor E]PMD52809.1 hypothetical protein K444DRAFT_192059 [Hyaloscypha bicolor E]